MGKLLPSYKLSLFEEMYDNIASNTSQYYAFVANPVYQGAIPPITNDDYSLNFINDWLMLFGKKIDTNDLMPMITKTMWASNTVYVRYDNTSNTLHTNTNFYVISEPPFTGGSYQIYVCIDNANGAPSTVDPGTVGNPTQATTFTTVPDNYKWRYIASVSSAVHDKFATADYFPCYVNNNIAAVASDYSGVEVVVIRNGGSGYETYSNGTIQSVVTANLIQIDSTSSDRNDYYTKNSIYIYNTLAATAQILDISGYVSNTTGKWIYLSSAANTSIITPGITQYKIRPKVVFESDGTSPVAYCEIDHTANNAIKEIVILDAGADISWANVAIQSNSYFGTGANLYAIVPPPGGHGFNPVSELDMKGIGISFNFANTESNNIMTSNVLYNKIGLIKNPYRRNADGSKGTRYYLNTFEQVTKANLNFAYTATVGESIKGATSNSRGIVAFANTTQIFLVGDHNWQGGESISNSTVSNVTSISINAVPDIYTKDILPLYVQNINNVNRSNTQTESYKLIIQV